RHRVRDLAAEFRRLDEVGGLADPVGDLLLQRLKLLADRGEVLGGRRIRKENIADLAGLFAEVARDVADAEAADFAAVGAERVRGGLDLGRLRDRRLLRRSAARTGRAEVLRERAGGAERAPGRGRCLPACAEDRVDVVRRLRGREVAVLAVEVDRARAAVVGGERERPRPVLLVVRLHQPGGAAECGARVARINAETLGGAGHELGDADRAGFRDRVRVEPGLLVDLGEEERDGDAGGGGLGCDLPPVRRLAARGLPGGTLWRVVRVRAHAGVRGGALPDRLAVPV